MTKNKYLIGIGATLIGICYMCLNTLAYNHTLGDLDFSSTTGYDTSATISTHGYEYDTANNKIYLDNLKVDGNMIVPPCEIVISDDVHINSIEVSDNYDSNFDLKISGSGSLIVYDILAGCGDLEFDGSNGLGVSVNLVNNHNTGGTGLFKITNMNDCTIRGISWTALDGLKVIDSNIELGTDNYVFVETIDMDVDSVINLRSDIGNYGNTLDGLDSLIDMIPSGYSIKYNQNILNSLYDADDNLVTNLTLKYRPTFNVKLSSNPDGIGIVSGSLTSVKDGDVINLTATSSNADYSFDYWEHNGVQISNLNNYDYTILDPDSDISIKAIFKYTGSNNISTGSNASTDSNASISGGVGSALINYNDDSYYTPKWIINTQGKRYRTSDGSYYKNVTKKIDGKIWSFDRDGYLYDGWFILNNEWYYQTLDGGLKSDWHFEEQDNKWYYLDLEKHHMLKGWQSIDNNWYYLHEYTPIQTWFYNDSLKEWYYLSGRPLGSLFVGEETPDGYKVNYNGAWIN